MNVSTLLTSASKRAGSHTALRYSSRRVTYSELQTAVDEFAGALLKRGLEPGDRVALFMGNNMEYVVGMFGAFRAGMAAVPVNAKLNHSELLFILENSEARALVFDSSKSDGDDAEELKDKLDVPIDLAEESGDGPPWSTFVAASGGEPVKSDADVRPTDIAWLFYTSGTTGRPKGALLSHRNLLSMTMSTLTDVYRFGADDIVLHCAPMSHGSGLYLLASIAAASDNLIYHESSFKPDNVLELMERERVTSVAFIAPTMIVMLLRSERQFDLSSLRRMIYGGAPIHVEHAQRMLDRFGQVFVQIFGQGEAPMTITCLPAEAHDREDPQALASAGFPRTNVEVGIVDRDGTKVPQGEDGEITVRGDVVMEGYLNNPEATAKSLRNGWLRTGDIGHFDTEGRLHLLDRKNDVIISGGTNIYPREVEEVLIQHDGVSEAVVWGAQDELWGERVVAAVVTDGALSPPSSEDLIAFCKSHIASFKKPSEVHFVDQLPKNAYGKVLRRQMREEFTGKST